MNSFSWNFSTKLGGKKLGKYFWTSSLWGRIKLRRSRIYKWNSSLIAQFQMSRHSLVIRRMNREERGSFTWTEWQDKRDMNPCMNNKPREKDDIGLRKERYLQQARRVPWDCVGRRYQRNRWTNNRESGWKGNLAQVSMKSTDKINVAYTTRKGFFQSADIPYTFFSFIFRLLFMIRRTYSIAECSKSFFRSHLFISFFIFSIVGGWCNF